MPVAVCFSTRQRTRAREPSPSPATGPPPSWGTTLYGDAQAVVAFDLASGDRRWASEPLGRPPKGLALSPKDDAIYVLINDPNELVVFERDG